METVTAQKWDGGIFFLSFRGVVLFFLFYSLGSFVSPTLFFMTSKCDPLFLKTIKATGEKKKKKEPIKLPKAAQRSAL